MKDPVFQIRIPGPPHDTASAGNGILDEQDIVVDSPKDSPFQITAPPTVPLHETALLGYEVSEEETIERLVGDSPTSIYSQLTSHLATPGASLAPSARVNALLSSLVFLLQRGAHSAAIRILQNPVLRARGCKIKELSNTAEDLLERHFARVLAEAPIPTHFTHNRQMTKIGALAAATMPFPYISNYVRLMSVECNVLAACIRAARDGRNANKIRFAVCGSGPMPLSGALACVELNAETTVIDVNASACALSKGVVARWESVGAIAKDAMRHVCADAADVRWDGDGNEANEVGCDAVLVASLVPDAKKLKVAQKVSSGGEDAPTVLAVRSAHGLTEVANYNAAPRALISKVMDFVGYIVPNRHVAEGRVRGEKNVPMAVFPEDVLNSLEIYARKSDGATLALRMREEVLRISQGSVADGHREV